MSGCFGPYQYRGGRVPTAFKYTYKDLSRLSGLPVGTLRKYVYMKRFNPYNLESVVEFLAGRLTP